jgi:hypothetical protein
VGIWFPELKLTVGETVVFQAAMNLFRGHRQIGGKVTVTGSRLIIMPNRLDALLGEKRIDVARGDINAVTIEPPGTAIARTRGLSARLRPQVEVHLSGVTLAMTVSDPSGLTQALLTTE